MKYTVQGGLQQSPLPRLVSRYKYLIPLLLLLIFVGYAGLTTSGPGRGPSKPLTLGIYTIKSSNDTGQAGAAGVNKPHTSSPSGTGSGSTPPAATAISTPAPAYSATGTPLQGGMGGGDTLGGTGITVPTGGDTGGSGGSTGSPPPTFSCLDAITNAVVTCTYQACTPPVSLLGGQKAYLTTTGTCVIIN